MADKRQLPLELPLPATGTAVILRLEDLQKIFAQAYRPGQAASPAAPRRQPGSARLRWMARHVAEVEHWLSGQAPAAMYRDGLERESSGAISSVTTDELTDSIPTFGDGKNRDRQKMLAGQVLSALGWQSRYLTASPGGKRERRFFPPPDWQ